MERPARADDPFVKHLLGVLADCRVLSRRVAELVKEIEGLLALLGVKP
jgi:hypothetical protein